MKHFILLIILFSSLSSNSQISSYFHGDYKDFNDLKTRNLIVELLEEDPKVLKKLDKPKKLEELKEYKREIKLYNEEIVIYAKKYWTLNSIVEFKKQSEVKALEKADNKSFAILRNLRLNDIDIDFRSRLYINAIVYTRIESNNNKPDSKVYFPVNSLKEAKLFNESDYKFCFDILQGNLNHIISNKKNISSEDYVKQLLVVNKEIFKTKTLLVRETTIHEKVTKEDCAKEYSGKVNFVSEDEINTAIINKDKVKLVLITVPYDIIKGQIGPFGQSMLTSYKVILDCETNKIVYVFMPTGFGMMGQNITEFMIPQDFKNITKYINK